MKQKKSKKKEIKKIVSLPEETVSGLQEIASTERTKVKPLMERIIINYEKEKSKP